MVIYIGRRLLATVPVLIMISVVTFGLANLAPGDPLDSFARPEAGMALEGREALRAALGLDQPVHVRYLAWIGQVLQGNLGTSLISRAPVTGIVFGRVGNTVLLMGSALLLSVVVGVALGVHSAYRAGSRRDRVLTIAVFSGISVPSYLLALIALMTLAVMPFQLLGIKIFPAGGIRDPLSPFPEVLDFLWHLALPMLVLAFAGTATFLRYTRASVLESMNQEHVTAARSKGLPERQIRTRHVLRNALLPVVTVVGLSLPALFTGAVFVESLFSWPGLGKLAVESTQQNDYPVIMAIALLTGSVIVICNLVIDLLYAVIDPRIRRS